MSETTTQQPAGAADTAAAPNEEELRAAYEAELSRITSADLVLQTVASLLNLGARRLGLTTDRRSVPDSGHAGGPPIGQQESEFDPEQARDAIDAVRGLMPVLERRLHGGELRQLRDALSQLQVGYARTVGPAQPAETGQAPAEPTPAGAPPSEQSPPDASPSGQPAAAARSGQTPPGKAGPGPAEASGRLWVPGR